MGVKHNVVDTGGTVHETIPVSLDTFKGVVYRYNSEAVTVADLSPSIVVELLQLIKVDIWAEWLVEKLNGGDNVGVSRISFCKVGNSGECLRDCIALLPVDCTVSTAVVESILRAGSYRSISLAASVTLGADTLRTSMQIQQNLDAR